MHLFSLHKRILVFWVVGVFFWMVILATTKLEVFPCQTFIFDSDQGYYNSICPLVDDRQVWVFESDTSGFSGIPTTATWLVGIPLIFGLPLVFSTLADLALRKIKKS